nr:uncharacterized protein LOC453169 [Pan troglodytes]
MLAAAAPLQGEPPTSCPAHLPHWKVTHPLFGLGSLMFLITQEDGHATGRPRTLHPADGCSRDCQTETTPHTQKAPKSQSLILFPERHCIILDHKTCVTGFVSKTWDSGDKTSSQGYLCHCILAAFEAKHFNI